MRRSVPFLLAVGAGLLIGPVRAGADELHAKTKKVAEALKTELHSKGRELAVAMGGFVSAARLEASGGPAIADAFLEALKGEGIRVDRDAALEITGRYSKGTSKESRLTSIHIRCQIVDNASGTPFADFDVSLVDPATIMRLAGGSGDISGKTREERSAKVDRNLDLPRVHLDPASTRISAAPGSPYAIEVLAGAEARPRAATVERGKAFLHIRDDETYAVRLINDSDLDAAVALAIDGLSMFAFSDDPIDRANLVIVKAHGQATIRGWYRNTSDSNEFLVAELGKAAVARQLPAAPEAIGTITATFSVAWERGTPPPPGEDDGVVQKGDSATALGKKIGQPFERVDFQFGRPRVVVSVRYNKAVEPGNLPK